MDFNGPARPLSGEDITLIAGYLGCHVAAVHAVLKVEAAGKGFDSKGRPKMLFEPHVFWRELGKGAKRDAAAKAGLAYAKWKPGAYPADSYPRLAKAMVIDERAALRSASWGLGQVMGFNHSAAGFPSVQEMVRAMTISEGAQLYTMARFIVTNALHRHLKVRDWEAFAKGYNGSGYRKNGYHTKLKTAYDKRPASEKVTPPPTTAAELEMLAGVLPKRPVEPTPTPPPVPPVVIPAPFDPLPEPVQRPSDWPESETAGPGESRSVDPLRLFAGALAMLGVAAGAVYVWNPLGWW